MLDQSPQKEAREILLGTVLGDAAIAQVSYKKATLQLAHGSQQLEYFIWKMKKLFPLVGSFRVEYRDSYTPSRKEYNGNIIVRGETFASKYLGHAFNDFYFFDSGIKRKEVKMNILNRLTPLSIAVWYMDDGCCVKESDSRIHSVRISTCCFTFEENNMICDWFRRKFDILFDVSNRGELICRRVVEIEKFLLLVEPYITIECMRYKVDPFRHSAGDVKTRQEIVRSLQQCKEIVRNSNPLPKRDKEVVEVSDDYIRKLAEWFDSYGNVTIYDHWLKGSGKIVLCVNNKDEQIPNSFKEIFGGSVSSFLEKRVKEPYRIFRYTATKNIAREVIKAIYPYLNRQKENERVVQLIA